MKAPADDVVRERERDELVHRLVNELGLDPLFARKAVLLAETCPAGPTGPAPDPVEELATLRTPWGLS